jgi:hypothetical protein
MITLAKRSSRWTHALVATALIGLGGCGYTQSGEPAADSSGYQWRSLYREDVSTVAVSIFGNRTYRRNFEFKLTKAIIDHLEADSPYKVVPRERADTILEGEVIAVDVKSISNSQAAIPQEQLLTIIVNFTWKDLRTGQILVERRGFEQSAPYYPTLGEGQFVAGQQNVERLALGIIQEMQADW